MPDTISATIANHRDSMISIRRDLHEHPELAFEEARTAKIIADRLQQLGYAVTTGLGKTGVVGMLRGKGAATGKTIMIRADIDALPVQELGDKPYISQTPGKMHACGHDGHVAIGLTVASTLVSMRDELHGNILMVFQPAEERASGAMEMIRDGIFDIIPKPDATIGLHLWSPFPVGTAGVKSGPFFASADEIMLKVKGKGGHGAMPETSIDPIVTAAYIVTALQTLVSREIAPSHRAVVTIGSIHGGTAFNIIADEVKMLGTVRAYDPADREHLLRRIPEVASSVAAAVRASCETTSDIGIPACVNNPAIASIVRQAAEEVLGKDNVREDCMQTVGDDMAYFLESVPGCYFLVGAGNPERGITAPHHSPLFDIDEESLLYGAEILVRAALLFLQDVAG